MKNNIAEFETSNYNRIANYNTKIIITLFNILLTESLE